MLAELKFVMGSVSKKDLVPAMKHFCIEKGMVRSYNGMVALCSPIPFDIDCNPHAETLYRAIENCDESVTLYMTPGGKLGVKSGKFRALIPCIEETAAHPEPEGEHVEFDGEALLKAFRVLEPIIGDDAARPWQAGILLKNGSAFATCNVVLAEYWLGVDFGHVVNVPGNAVREMIRVGKPPIDCQLTDTSITFHYECGRWIRSQLLPCDWPDLGRILEPGLASNHTEVDPVIFEACERLKKFVDKTEAVYFEGGEAFTHRNREEGSSWLCESVRWSGVYTRSMLMLLQPVAKTVDFSHWPKPCYFFGDRLRGAIIGRAA